MPIIGNIRLIIKTLQEVKSECIKVIDVRKQTILFSYMIIATGVSSRQVPSTCNSVKQGAIYDADALIYIITKARYLKGGLKNNGVASTLMVNKDGLSLKRPVIGFY